MILTDQTIPIRTWFLYTATRSSSLGKTLIFHDNVLHTDHSGVSAGALNVDTVRIG